MNGFIGTEAIRALGGSTILPQVLTVGQVSQLGRPEIFTWIDSHEDSLGLCLMNIFYGGWYHAFEGLPGSRHGGGAGVVFMDAHAENHKWKNEETRVPVTGTFNFGFDYANPVKEDFIWLRERMIRSTQDRW